jgi:hypothetical protein
MSLYPLAYAGGEFPEPTSTLMPALVTSYEQGLRWKEAPIGKELTRLLDERKGVKIITWVWQAGGIASKRQAAPQPRRRQGHEGARRQPRDRPDAQGRRRLAVTNVPSSEIYSAMQSGVLDAAITSSTSLISFRLHETCQASSRPRARFLLVHVRAAADVEEELRQADPGAAEAGHGSRRLAGEVRHGGGQGRRPARGRGVHKSAGDGGAT